MLWGENTVSGQKHYRIYDVELFTDYSTISKVLQSVAVFFYEGCARISFSTPLAKYRVFRSGNKCYKYME